MARDVLPYVSKSGAVAELLRREIFSSRLKPGTQLRQEQIAARLGVSPTPVREAFRILESEGYVESRHHRGVVVAERNYGDLIDIYEVRLAIETIAVRRIVDRPTIAVVSALSAEVERAARAMKRGDTARFRHANSDFHAALVHAPDSQVLRNVMARLSSSWFFFPQDPDRMAAQHRDHVEVLEAIRRGDQDAAISVLTTHVEENIRILKEWQRGSPPMDGVDS